MIKTVIHFGASMRPGHYCPGRRSTWPKSARRRSPSFNEAGALLPRKARLLREAVSHTGYASMRPGHYCPGRMAEASRSMPRATRLQ